MLPLASLLANHVTWTVDQTAEAAEIAHVSIDEVEAFLTSNADVPLSVCRSSAGDLLIRSANDDLLITGNTAEVLSAYIDRTVSLCRMSPSDRLRATWSHA